ncbi:MAG: Ger(x)C family spore germination protein [Bacillaceae bacterium]|nr:Ger(x)C family spore germination protein [Bacillaceae bacterium]
MKQPKWLKLMLLIVILSFSLTGCWSSRELSEAAFLAGAAITKEDDEYKIIFQVLQPTQIKNETPEAFVMISSTGPTIPEAIRRLIKGLKRRLYLTHTRVLVVDSKVAKEEGFFPLLDYGYREQQFRLTSYLYIADDPDGILGQQSPLDPMTAFGLSTGTDTIKQDLSEMAAVNLKDFAEMALGPTGDSYVTILKMHTEEKPAMTHVDIDGTALLKDGKFVKSITDPTVTRGLLRFHNEVPDGIISVKVDHGNASIDVLKSSTKISPRIQNGKLTVDIQVQEKADIADWESNKTLDEKMLKKLENNYARTIKREMKKALEIMRQDPVTDVSQIGVEVYRQLPHYWQQVHHDWDEQFKNLEVNIQVQTQLQNMGLIQHRNRPKPKKNDVKLLP